MQTDLGVRISEDLKWEEHISVVTKRAKSLIYLVRKAFGILTPEMMLRILKSHVRPILEYGFQIWNPYFKKDIDLLERVQRSFTKVPRSLKRKSYEDRLKVLNLTTLKERRDRGDLIETFKILNGHYDIEDFDKLYKQHPNPRSRAAHCRQLMLRQSKNNPHRHFLTNRVVRAWNALPEHVVMAPNTNTFKNRLDKHISLKEKN